MKEEYSTENRTAASQPAEKTAGTGSFVRPEKSLFGKVLRRLGPGGCMTVIFLALLAVFAFYVNRNIRIDALYMDDLYMWSFYGEQSVFEFTFPFRTSTRFRPVCWLLTYLQMATVGTDVSGYVTFNILANIVLAWTIYGMANQISGNRIAAFLASFVFLASRLSYYQIGQALGYMETLACFFSLLVLFFLYRYLTVPNDDCGTDFREDPPLFTRSDQRYFAVAMLAYVLVSFTHERYITLGALFYLTLLLKLLKEKKNNRKAWWEDNRFLWIIPAVSMAGILLIRFIFTGKSIPAGTGGTQVTETFSITQTLRYCLSQVLYLLGINDGPEHLCAIPWENTPDGIKNLIKASIVCYGLLGLGFLCSMVRDLKHPAVSGRNSFCRKAAVSLLFAGFLALCIGSSSVTVRLEMRWIYVSFAAMQLFACYMISAETSGSAFARPAVWLATIVYTVYAVLSVQTNGFCRGYVDRLYFMEGQNRANSIAEQTIHTYGAGEVLGKTVFLVGTTYEISDFYCDYFFRPFDPEKTGQGTRIVLVDTMEEALWYLQKKQSPEDREETAIFLTEDPVTKEYIPVPGIGE